jgi:phosphonate transport system substrate-binding protein
MGLIPGKLLLNFILLLAITFISSLYVPSIAESKERKEFILAVMPEVPPVTVYKSWTPFVNKLSEETGLDIKLKVYDTFSQFENDLFKGAPDFVFLCSFYVTLAKKKQGYIPLVRNETLLEGIVVVRKDGPIHSVQDLNGKEIAFPTPNNFAASLYIRKMLTEKEKIHFTPRYVGTHSNVYRNVILGKVDAGGGANISLNSEPEEVRSQLRIIYKTQQAAPHPLVAHPRVPDNLRKTVVDVILRLAKGKDNRDLLNAIRISNPVKADYKRDYESTEKLGLERYCELSGVQ